MTGLGDDLPVNGNACSPQPFFSLLEELDCILDRDEGGLDRTVAIDDVDNQGARNEQVTSGAERIAGLMPKGTRQHTEYRDVSPTRGIALTATEPQTPDGGERHCPAENHTLGRDALLAQPRRSRSNQGLLLAVGLARHAINENPNLAGRQRFDDMSSGLVPAAGYRWIGGREKAATWAIDWLKLDCGPQRLGPHEIIKTHCSPPPIFGYSYRYDTTLINHPANS